MANAGVAGVLPVLNALSMALTSTRAVVVGRLGGNADLAAGVGQVFGEQAIGRAVVDRKPQGMPPRARIARLPLDERGLVGGETSPPLGKAQ